MICLTLRHKGPWNELRVVSRSKENRDDKTSSQRTFSTNLINPVFLRWILLDVWWLFMRLRFIMSFLYSCEYVQINNLWSPMISMNYISFLHLYSIWDRNFPYHSINIPEYGNFLSSPLKIFGTNQSHTFLHGSIFARAKWKNAK